MKFIFNKKWEKGTHTFANKSVLKQDFIWHLNILDFLGHFVFYWKDYNFSTGLGES